MTSQQKNLDDVTSQLEEGFSALEESLDEVYSKLDTLSQSVVDFQLDLSTQFEEIKLEDTEAFIADLNSINK